MNSQSDTRSRLGGSKLNLIKPRSIAGKTFRWALALSMMVQLLAVPYSFNGILANGNHHDDDDDEECELVITKIGTPTQVNPGGQIVYEVKVKNVGDDNCTGEGVGVVETYDGKTTFVSSSPAATQGNNYWNLDTVEPGEEVTIDITVTVSASAQNGDVLTNKACVWAYQQGDKDDDDAWKCATATTTVKTSQTPDMCNMEISKVVAQSEINPGEEIDYTITVKNTGNATCTGGGVEVQEYYDQHVSFVSANPSPAAANDNWNFGVVFPGDEHTIAVTVDSSEQLNDGDSIKNKACVWAYQQGDKTNPANWKCAEVTTKVVEPPLGNGCSLQVIKDDNKDPVAPGESFAYTVTVKNAGDEICTGGGVEMKEFYDAMTQFQSASPVPSQGNSLWNFGTMFPGDTHTVTIQMTMVPSAQDGAIAVNKACAWAFQNGPKDDAASWVCDEETTTVKKVPSGARLEISKKVSDNNEQNVDSNTTVPGTSLTYSLVVKNAGNEGAMDVVLTDDYNQNFIAITNSDGGVDANGIVTWTIGVINPGQSVSKTVQATIASSTPDATKIINIAAATASNASTVEDAAETHVFVLPAGEGIDVSVAKTVSPQTIINGSDTTFTITVTNAGPQAATGITIKDTLPSGLTYVSDDGAGAFSATSSLWQVGTLTTNESKALKLTVHANSNGTFTNTAEAIAYQPTDIDSTPNNQNAQEDDQAEATVVVKDKEVPGCSGSCGGGGGRSNYPIIGIDKKVSKTTVSQGETVTYTLTITAGGDDESANVMVSDTLPKGLSYADGSASPRMWVLGNMAYGTTKTVTYDVKVDQSAVTGKYENIAVATIGNGIPPENRDEARATVEILSGGGGGGGGGSTPTALLNLDKAASVAFINPDAEFTYTVTVQNTGTAKATNVRVDDSLPGGFTFVDGGGAVKIFSLGDMTPGETKQVLYAVRVAHDTTAGRYANFATVRADNAPADSDSEEVEVRTVTVHKFTELPDTGIESGVAVQAGTAAGVMIAIGGFILRKKREDVGEFA